MNIPEGFVVGGRYRVLRQIASGASFLVYEAEGLEDGPGQVCVKVARHDPAAGLQGLVRARGLVEREWKTLLHLHENGSTALPMPLELVRMYPADREVRALALQGEGLVGREPYLVAELSDGRTLAELLRSNRLDDDRALEIALRIILFARRARQVGVHFDDFSPTNFILDDAGENLTVVGLTPPLGTPTTGRVALPGDEERVSEGFGRLLVGLLSGIAAPPWPTAAEDKSRWEQLLERRRIPTEYRKMVLGALGYADEFSNTLEAFENRLRALCEMPRMQVYKHPGSHQTSPWLIQPGEIIGGRFEVIGTLAQGGRGFVYRVRDQVSTAEVLIKCNKYLYDSGSEFALELATRRQEIEHEYAVLKEFSSWTAMLPQPIALVHEGARGAWFDLAPDLARNEPYMVMERIRGIPLLDLLSEPLVGLEGASIPGNRLDARFVLRLITQVADLLSHVHDLGYLYQDLKPENILYDPVNENIFLIDFATACPRLEDGRLDREHVAFGVQTNGFAAPEFEKLWEQTDDRFDIYSLGATAFHLLTGVNPERLAIETSQEYPKLPLKLLDGVPRPVASLVRDCLAPVEQRIASAAQLLERAEQVRLHLSRTRPLDVLAPELDYVEEGVRLRWKLPNDPRVSGIRVKRLPLEWEGKKGETIYSGPVSDQVLDAVPKRGDRMLLVETLARRGATSKGSRGVLVRVPAHPAATRFDVQPWFGRVHLRVEAAPHADALELRWSQAEPPLTPDEGEPLIPDAEGRVQHTIPPGTTAHYTIFARYGAEIAVPRFASASVLDPVPAEVGLELEQSEEALTVRWEHEDPRLVALVRQGRGAPRRLRPAPGERQVQDTRIAPNSACRIEIVAEEQGVRSGTIEAREIQRWPAMPTLELRPGAGSVQVQTVSALPGSITGFEYRVPGPSSPDPLWRPVGLGRSVSLPAGEAHRFQIRALVQNEEPGPSREFRLVLPPVQPELELDVGAATLPLRGRVRLQWPGAPWTGTYRLLLRCGAETLFDHTGGFSEIFQETDLPAGGGWLAGRSFDFPEQEPGAQIRPELWLSVADGEELAHRAFTIRVLEKLPPPRCTPLLAQVRVEADEELPEHVDLRLDSPRGQALVEHVALPYTFAQGEGESVAVRVRRHLAGEPMPWSEPQSLAALARPVPPQQVHAELREGQPVLAWAPASEPDSVFEVRDDQGQLVYQGAASEYVPPPGVWSTSWELLTRRPGLESHPLRFEPPAGLQPASPPAALAVVPMQPPAVLGVPAHHGPDRLMRTVRAGRLGVAELRSNSTPRLVVIMDSGTAPPVPGREQWFDPAALLAGHGVRGGGMVQGVRVLVPWVHARPAPVDIWSTGLPLARPRWSLLARSVEVEAGMLVGAVREKDTVLHLSSPGGTLELGPTSVLELHEESRVVGVPLQEVSGEPVGRIPWRWGVQLAVAPQTGRTRGVGLSAQGRPAVLVPLVQTGRDAAAISTWKDTATGVAQLLIQTLEIQWGIPVVRQHLGVAPVAFFLYQGSPVELQISVRPMDAKGTAELEIRLASFAGEGHLRARLKLSQPGTWSGLFQKWVRWIVRRFPVQAAPAAQGLLSS